MSIFRDDAHLAEIQALLDREEAEVSALEAAPSLAYTVDRSWTLARSWDPDGTPRPTKWHRARAGDRGLAWCSNLVLNVEDATPVGSPLAVPLCRRCFPPGS